MDLLEFIRKDTIDEELPEPSPQLFEVSYNDDFPIAKKRSLGRLRANTCLDDVPEFPKSRFSFASVDSISVEPEEDEYRPLNHGFPSCSQDIPVRVANDRLVTLLTPLFEEIYEPERKVIWYHKMEESSFFNQFLHFSRDLQMVDLTTGTADERMALFTNVFNIMVLHMGCRFGPPQDLWQRRKFVNTTYYQVHEHKYSLHSILNGILRSNRKGHGMLWKPFGNEDLRLPLILPKCDPLIHFALITSTMSSPKLRIYTCENIWEEMRGNAVDYLLYDKNLVVDTKRQLLLIPKIFKWYAIDFGGSQEKCVEWIVKNLKESESEKYNVLQEMVQSKDHIVEYAQYDWEFNGAGPEDEN